jgi:hypothetical protein
MIWRYTKLFLLTFCGATLISVGGAALDDGFMFGGLIKSLGMLLFSVAGFWVGRDPRYMA